MTHETRSMFNDSPGEPIRERRGHVPSLRLTRTGVIGDCSCGVKLVRASGCNRGGVGYAVSAAKHKYLNH